MLYAGLETRGEAEMTAGIGELFWEFLQIGLCSIGGGYATIPLIQAQVVEGRQWLTLQEFTDILTISQMTPGPLAVNVSTFVGLRTAGIPGAIAATAGCVLCGCCLLYTSCTWPGRALGSRCSISASCR